MAIASSVWTQYGVGQYVAGEGHYVILPKAWRPDQSKRVVIACHGAGWYGLNAPVADPEIFTLAQYGLPVISCDLGGPTTFGNDTAMSRIDSAWTFAKTQFGVATDKFLLFGASMGGQNSLVYIANNPTNVAAMVGICPLSDLAWLHDNVPFYTGLIEAAYGGFAGYQAALPTHNPVQMQSTLAAADVPMKFWLANDDEYIPYASSVAFAAAIGATVVDMGAVGHTFPPPNLDPVDPMNFLKAYA